MEVEVRLFQVGRATSERLVVSGDDDFAALAGRIEAAFGAGLRLTGIVHRGKVLARAPWDGAAFSLDMLQGALPVLYAVPSPSGGGLRPAAAPVPPVRSVPRAPAPAPASRGAQGPGRGGSLDAALERFRAARDGRAAPPPAAPAPSRAQEFSNVVADGGRGDRGRADASAAPAAGGAPASTAAAAASAGTEGPGSGAICRICYGGAEPGAPLFTPCRCRGSIAFVHPQCLAQWRSSSVRRGAYSACEMCGFRYAVERVSFANLLLSERAPAAIAVALLLLSSTLLGAVVTQGLSLLGAERPEALALDRLAIDAGYYDAQMRACGVGAAARAAALRAAGVFLAGLCIQGLVAFAICCCAEGRRHLDALFDRDGNVNQSALLGGTMFALWLKHNASNALGVRLFVVLGSLVGLVALSKQVAVLSKRVVQRFGERVLAYDASAEVLGGG